MSHQIQELLKNNDEPCDAAVREVQGILAGPLEEVEVLDSEIQQLEGRLAELKIRRNQIQETISRYSIITSPFRRIPHDILHNVFYHCLPTHRNSLMVATEAPVLLTRICNKWRTTALASPRLWAQIHITFSDGDLLPEDPLRPDVMYTDGGIDVARTLRLRCKAVEEWLSRSGTCPLSISINYTKSMGSTIDDLTEGISDITLQLLSILCSFAKSWQSIQLEMPFEIYDLLEHMIHVPELETLNFLKIDLHQSPWGLEDGSQTTSKTMRAPNLKRLSMLAVSNYPRLPNIPPSWRNLTDISCHSTITVSETINILETCPNLVYFMVTMETVYPIFSPILHQKLIPLPYLRVLHISDYTTPETIGDLYDCIHAPQLEWVNYSSQSPTGGLSDEYLSAPPVTTLLRKSSALKKLTLETHARCTALDIRQIFQSVRNITHLVMGWEARVSDDGPLRRISWPPSRHQWDFGELFDSDVTSQDTGPGGDLMPTIVLPHLHTLEVSNGVPIDIPEEALLHFILGRMDPSSDSVAVLKHVSIFYNRGTTKSIAGDVYRHAQLKGIDVKLELDYAGRSPTERFTHPRFGLNHDNDRSWKYLDNEDYEKMMPIY